MDYPRVNLSLDIPAQRLLSSYVQYDRDMEEQVKIGIENAINRLTTGNNLAKLVEEQVYETLKSSFSEWNVRSQIREIFNSKMEQFIQAKATEFAEKMMRKVDM